LVGLTSFLPYSLAVSISVSAEDISGKIIGIWWPIFTFALSGYEHSIANMFFATLAALEGAEWNYG
jgi:formate/nitrite transporter FocA (FNT family)